MLHAFHSCWTAPAGHIYHPEAFELLSTALSALCWRRENGPIRMICDSPALSYFEENDLCFLWDEGLQTLLDAIPDTINPQTFWAAGKLYALGSMPAPCVMLDTDFIVWRPILDLLQGCTVAAIHSEDLAPEIYPDATYFSSVQGFDFDTLDWTVRPMNTALCYIAEDDFLLYYVQRAIDFIKAAGHLSDRLCPMVFAEQRLLSMCAAQRGIMPRALFTLPQLFGDGGKGYFTHLWGTKQQMREDGQLHDTLCARMAARLMSDFSDESLRLCKIPLLARFFDQ